MFNVGDRVINDYYGEGTVINTKSQQWSGYPIAVSFGELDIEYFNEEGYYNDSKRESEMIKLITHTNDVNEGYKQHMNNNSTKYDINQTNCMLRALSDNNRKFKIKYRDIQQYINKDPLSHSKVKTITGTIENFNPNTEVVIHSEEDGFCIIQYRQILQMEEIMED